MKFVPFNYLDVSLNEAAYINGVPYFTRKSIGEWLGYEEPQKAVDRIILRNPHIDNPEWSVHVNLTCTDSKNYLVNLYSPIGLQLIVFESRQPKAIQYKIAVAKLVADMASGRFFINSTLDLINSIPSRSPLIEGKSRKRFSLFPSQSPQNGADSDSAKLENSSNFPKGFKT